ncbi:hypothetical protein ACWFQ8_18650 [Streptomyces sp. NPDC055254]
MTATRFGSSPQRLTVIAAGALAVLAVFAWYSTQTVYPHCVVGVSKLIDENGNTAPDANGRVRSDKELADLAFEQARASGRCDPGRLRWQQWLD